MPTIPDTPLTQTIAFIGGGNMACSLLDGLLTAGVGVAQLRVAEPVAARRDWLQQHYAVRVVADNAEAVAGARIVVLAVKPQVMPQALTPLGAPLQTTQPLVISIAAGIRIATLHRYLGGELACIRAMPNTPATLNCGVSGLYAHPHATATHRRQAEQILGAVGTVVWVKTESLLDVVTGISGSGPAYYFQLMEVMVASAIAHGLEPATAKTLVLQTALGAAKLAMHSDPATLRQQVTSPGGTTEAALQTMAAHGLANAIQLGITAAIEKSAELAAANK